MARLHAYSSTITQVSIANAMNTLLFSMLSLNLHCKYLRSHIVLLNYPSKCNASLQYVRFIVEVLDFATLLDHICAFEVHALAECDAFH